MDPEPEDKTDLSRIKEVQKASIRRCWGVSVYVSPLFAHTCTYLFS